MNLLHNRLAALRRRLRVVTLWRGVGSVLALVLACALFAFALDWAFSLPSMVRAIVLVSILAATGYVGHQYLIRPLREKTDDLSLALRVEDEYPELNDALASTVEFLKQQDEATNDSPVLRRQAIESALRQVQGHDFNKVVDSRGVRIVGVSATLAIAAAVWLFLWHGDLAETALCRLVEPFGNHTWTQLTILPAPDRIAQEQTFEIRGLVQGVVPPFARVEVDGMIHADRIVKIENGQLTEKFFETKKPGKFRFRVTANDAVYPPRRGAWREVEIVPPPKLAALDGLPSPQLVLHPPAYTEKAAERLSPGARNIDAVSGTWVFLRAAADRPLREAWIEFRPNNSAARPALLVQPLASHHVLETLARLAGGHAVTGRLRARLADDGHKFAVDFLPWVSGSYILFLVDHEGLGKAYESDVRITADPVPLVNLERPASKQSVLSDADILVKGLVEDDLAIRTIFLELRRRQSDGSVDAEPRVIALYSQPASGEPRAKQKEIGHRLALARLDVKDGDVLLLQACAEDFNNVSPFNPPGRSHEVELHIVSRQELAKILDNDLAEVQQDLVRVHQMQQQALKQVEQIQKQLDKKDKDQLDKKTNLHDQVVEAEQLQKQIQERIGARPDEGIRSKLEKIQQTLRDNKLPASDIKDRVRNLTNELARIQQEELQPIESNLAEARKEVDRAPDAKSQKPDAKGKADSNDPKAGKTGTDSKDRQPSALDKARQHQEQAEKDIAKLLENLNPWASMQEIRGKARDIRHKQIELAKEIAKMPDGAESQNKDDLPKAIDAQNRLAEDMEKLNKLMKQVQTQRVGEKDQQNADALTKALEAGKNLPSQMRDTKGLLEKKDEVKGEPKPQRHEAQKKQHQVIEGLDKVIAALEGRSDEDIADLLKKQRDQEGALAQIQKEQDQLQKKVQKQQDELDILTKKKKKLEDELEKKSRDPDKVKAELAGVNKQIQQNRAGMEKMAEEQRALQKKVEEQARELAKLQAEEAARELRKAGKEMDRAAQMLERGEDPQDAQDEALDRIEQAQQQLQEAQDELVREQLAKIADQLKGLKDRQDAAVAESLRIHRDSIEKRRQWTQATLQSLGQLASSQRTLEKETNTLREKLKGAKVFEQVMDRAARHMDQAAKAMDDRRESGRDRQKQLDDDELAHENRMQSETLRHQQDAARRLQRLLDALKNNPDIARRPEPKQGDGKQGDPKQGEQQGGMRGPGEGIPDIAQLKVLREEQKDVMDKTKALVDQQASVLVGGGGALTPAPVPPETTPLTQAQRRELTDLQREQATLRDLFEQLTTREKKGDNP